MQRRFLERVRDTFHVHGVSPTCLELEITETTLMEDTARTVRILDALYGMGLHLAIDDFGTGYSSLGYLKELAFDVLKIDRAFVDAIPDRTSIAIIHAVMTVARSLGKDVVAEGVETEQQRQELRRMGCHIGQGYLFARPCEASALPAWAAALAAGRHGADDDAARGEGIGTRIIGAISG